MSDVNDKNIQIKKQADVLRRSYTEWDGMHTLKSLNQLNNITDTHTRMDSIHKHAQSVQVKAEKTEAEVKAMNKSVASLAQNTDALNTFAKQGIKSLTDQSTYINYI